MESKRRIQSRNKRIFFKTIVVTAVGMILLVLGFLGAGFFSGAIR